MYVLLENTAETMRASLLPSFAQVSFGLTLRAKTAAACEASHPEAAEPTSDNLEDVSNAA